jgi:hypothetical protein
MLRAFGAFLLVFCLLALTVHFDGLAQAFGGAALVLLVIDLFLTRHGNVAPVSGARTGSML